MSLKYNLDRRVIACIYRAQKGVFNFKIMLLAIKVFRLFDLKCILWKSMTSGVKLEKF